MSYPANRLFNQMEILGFLLSCRRARINLSLIIIYYKFILENDTNC